jgi:hypothetical protein
MQTTLTKNLPIQIEGLSKTGIETLANTMVSEVLNGNENPGELYIKLDFLKKALDKAMKEIKEGAIEELAKYDKGQTLGGVEFSVQDKGRASYNHHEAWQKKKEELTAIETDMKAAAKSGNNIVTEDGEIIPPAMYAYSTSITPTYPY